MSITRLAGYIPDLPRDMSVVKDMNGNYSLNTSMQLNLSNLYQALQGLISNDGLQLPPLSPTQQANIAAIYTALIGFPLPPNTPNIAGRMAYDYTNNVPIVFIITFNTAVNPYTVTGASWKTFTI
jgi:hypothetical protein